MFIVEVSGVRVQGRLRLGWMHGVKVALGKRDDFDRCVTMHVR